MKTIPLVSLDFLDEHKTRHTTFEICRREAGRLVSTAIINLGDGGRVTRAIYTPENLCRTKAILRLAKRYQQRSIPQCFN